MQGIITLSEVRRKDGPMTPRMAITWQVLEAAKDARDELVIAACRRIINAHRIGWHKHGNPEDFRLVLEFAQ
jgi:hypothetical protein